MANAIRYSTTGDTQSLKSGNFFFGVGDVGKGPSSATTYYNGVTPVVSGYTIYTYNASQTSKISFASANNDSELVTITNNLSGQNFTTATQCLNWYVTQSNYVCVNKDYENIVTNGLILSVDAGFTPSYTTSGTTWYDLAYSGYNNSLLNGLTYTPQYSGGLIFDNTNDYVQVNTIDLNALGATRNYTICFSCIKEFFGTGGNLFGDSALIIGGANGYDSGWRIQEGNSGTPGSPFNGRHQFRHGAPAISNNLQVTDGVNIHRPVYLCYSISTGTTFGYCNGSVASGVTGTYSNGSSYGTIGLGTYGVGYFGGKIYNYQIYNRPLTLTEVKQNYLAFLDRFVGKNLVTDNLSLYLDANYRGSYPTSGTTWADVSGNNINGTLTNGPTYSTDGGGSIVFDGIDDYVSVSNFMGSTRTFTVSHFIYLNTSQNTRTIFSNYATSGVNGWVTGIRDGVNNVVKFYLGNTVHLYSNAVLQNQSWYHVTVTYDNGNPKIYINGVLDASSSDTITFASSYSGNDIGRLGSNIQYFNGRISQLSTYNRALSSSEILQNYQAQFPTVLGENIITNGLVLYLDAGYRTSYPTTGTTWTNVSGVSGGTGTLTNGPTYDSGNGGSIDFDGTNDYVSISNPSTIMSKTSYTKTAWFNIDGATYNIISGGDTASHAFWMAGTTKLNAGHNGNWSTVQSTTTLTAGVWYHGAVTFDTTSGWKLYLNGVLESTSSNTTTFYGINDILFIGAFNAAQNLFSGKVATVNIYNRVLLQSEIQQNFNAQKSRYGL